MLRRSTGHREDLAVQVLVTDAAELLDVEIVLKRVAMARGCDHTARVAVSGERRSSRTVDMYIDCGKMYM